MKLAGPILVAALAVAEDAHADTWRELRTPNFTLVGNGESEEMRRLAIELERFRIIVRLMPRMMDSDPTVPVLIVAAKDIETYRRLAPTSRQDGFGGFFQNVGVQVQAIIRLDQADSIAVAYHEYHHLLTDRADPTMPAWLGEGLAKTWEGLRVDGRQIDLGHPDALSPHVWSIRNGPLIPMRELITAGYDSKYFSQRNHRGTFYAQSAVLTHMLLFEKPDPAARLGAFLGAVALGTPPVRAFEETWGPIDENEHEFLRYLGRSDYTHRVSTLSADPSAATVLVSRVLTPAEADAYQGQFLAYGGQKERAKRLLVDALVEDPTNVVATTALASIGPQAQALALLERARADPRAGFDTYWHSALRRSPGNMPATNQRGTEKLAAEVEAHLRRTIALAPRFAPAYVRLANLLADEDKEEAITLLRKVVEIEPKMPVYRVRLAKMVRRSGDLAGSRQLVDEAVRLAITIPRARVVDDVCRYGTVAGLAREVLPACDAAVERNPSENRTRRVRGLARAAAGDVEGALQDFRTARDALRDGESDVMIKALEAGRNPVSPEALRELEALEDALVGRL